MFSKLTFVEGRKTYHGVNGILTQYHIRYHPYLGLGECAIKYTLCLYWSHKCHGFTKG